MRSTWDLNPSDIQLDKLAATPSSSVDQFKNFDAEVRLEPVFQRMQAGSRSSAYETDGIPASLFRMIDNINT